MAAKEIKRLDANLHLTAALYDAIKAGHAEGLSTDDIKAQLERFVSLMEEE
jgi:hypothetical protein